MDKFQEMQAFVAVVDAGSFVRAADALGSSKAAVSRYISDLEDRLGVRLLNRTTRSLSMTGDGQAFYYHCVELLAALDEAEGDLSTRSAEASGLVRISAPVTFGILHLAPLWGDFLERYPKVRLEVALSDRAVDLVEDGFDLAIRISSVMQPSLIARRLATTRLVLCASPSYLERRGTPQHASELAQHDVVAYTYGAFRDEWIFEGPDGEVRVKVSPRLFANNGDTCRAAALRGQGVILQPDFLVGGDLRSGELVEILPGYRTPDLGVYALYASRRHLPLKLRYLIDFLVEAFKPAA
ncbi:LysR family transcriptional regulator [Massilia soli]|uniref:LysR family transcriptional regulator n=1 Tax=Massilia soli TaxID=2792854 RepID=A0ABS7SS36_9BURK|nr:LysR family transcriptional regulator [Massilia soli]MBZ2208768.1 LysR family transcriptional regulator [Massilia soli]